VPRDRLPGHYTSENDYNHIPDINIKPLLARALGALSEWKLLPPQPSYSVPPKLILPPINSSKRDRTPTTTKVVTVENPKKK
jgi:hypothetical protein